MQLLVYMVLLFPYWDNPSTLASKAVNNYVKLDMATDSAAYIFTQTPEADQAAIDYITKEWARRGKFLQVWDEAHQALGPHVTIPAGLRREHLMAIHAYTQESTLFREFNKAIRQCGVNDTIYHMEFHFKSFHYLLSVALDKLKRQTHSTFRGVGILFNATKGEAVRLGQFSSTSLDTSVAIGFLPANSTGNTLFEIETRLGVPIRKLSAIYYENEVLIPPIEVFEVINVPHWQKNGETSWVSIKLAAKGCQGIAATVDTSNGAFKVKRGDQACPKHCQCLDT
ncbi:ecto-ADP-ribosyltransferase 5-like [Cetorhinus maximus]